MNSNTQTSSGADEEECWRAVLERSRSHDGMFFFATTSNSLATHNKLARPDIERVADARPIRVTAAHPHGF